LSTPPAPDPGWTLPRLRVGRDGEWSDDDVEITHAGILANLRSNLRRDAEGYFIQTRARIPVEVEDVPWIVTRVSREGEPVTFAEREHARLIAVAMRPEALSRERLTDMLWPDLAENAARNAFHVCLHRLKTRLGDENAVVRTREGYRLGNDVKVDLWEIDRAVSSLRTNDEIDAHQASGLRALYDRLRASRPPKPRKTLPATERVLDPRHAAVPTSRRSPLDPVTSHRRKRVPRSQSGLLRGTGGH